MGRRGSYKPAPGGPITIWPNKTILPSKTKDKRQKTKTKKLNRFPSFNHTENDSFKKIKGRKNGGFFKSLNSNPENTFTQQLSTLHKI